MSDYLWDKKGDADEEVARLETLLGAFGHEPRPLALPAGAKPEPRAGGLLPFISRLRASRLFAPAALATAALVVASVFAASIFFRAERPAPHADAVVKSNLPPEVKDKKTRDEATPAVVKAEDRNVKADKVNVAVESLPHVARRRKDVQVAAVSSRRRLPTAETVPGRGLTLEQMSTPSGASTLVQNTRLLAKEQLVYALRFTGAKLKDVQEKASRQ
jgi:hypothetical protein